MVSDDGLRDCASALRTTRRTVPSLRSLSSLIRFPMFAGHPAPHKSARLRRAPASVWPPVPGRRSSPPATANGILVCQVRA